jgi:D-hexose-6-phosphate mutarotase
MDNIIHKIAAQTHFDIAEQVHAEYEAEQNNEKKIALRTVSAQNYFYAAVNAIEKILAEKLEQHSFNHENRMRKIVENQSLFSQEIIALYELVDRDLRNKVAYRGENGKKYEAVKRLATLLCGAA